MTVRDTESVVDPHASISGFNKSTFQQNESMTLSQILGNNDKSGKV